MPPWQREAQAAVRTAAALFDRSGVAWIDAQGVAALADPSQAMEALFRGLIDGSPIAKAAADREAPAVSAGRAPRARPPQAPSMPQASSTPQAPSRRAGTPPPAPFAAGFGSIGAEAPAAPAAPHTDSPEDSQASPAPPRRDSLRSAVPPAPRSTLPDRFVVDRPAAEASDELARRMTLHRPPATPPSGGTGASKTRPLGRIAPASLPTEAPAGAATDAGTRQLTTPAELQGLFRAVVAESRSAAIPAPAATETISDASGERPVPPTPPSRSRSLHLVRSDEPRAIDRAPSPIDVAADEAPHADAIGAASAVVAGNAAADRSRALPPSLVQNFAAAADPVDEEVLLDRLLDRFEERMREQAIRHFGFTGGLI